MFVSLIVIIWKKPKVDEPMSNVYTMSNVQQMSEDTVIMPNVVENNPPYQCCQHRNCTQVQPEIPTEPDIIYDTVSHTGSIDQSPVGYCSPVEHQPVEHQTAENNYSNYSNNEENDFLSIVNFIHNL